MHSLEGIIAANRAKPIKAESNFDRHCSFSGDAETGVVLHSARHRATVFLKGAAKGFQSPAARFLSAISKLESTPGRNVFIESYFE